MSRVQEMQSSVLGPVERDRRNQADAEAGGNVSLDVRIGRCQHNLRCEVGSLESGTDLGTLVKCEIVSH